MNAPRRRRRRRCPLRRQSRLVRPARSTRSALTVRRMPIFICALPGCNRLFRNRDTLMQHRKRVHTELDGEDESQIVTWNEG